MSDLGQLTEAAPQDVLTKLKGASERAWPDILRQALGQDDEPMRGRAVIAVARWHSQRGAPFNGQECQRQLWSSIRHDLAGYRLDTAIQHWSPVAPLVAVLLCPEPAFEQVAALLDDVPAEMMLILILNTLAQINAQRAVAIAQGYRHHLAPLVREQVARVFFRARNATALLKEMQNDPHPGVAAAVETMLKELEADYQRNVRGLVEKVRASNGARSLEKATFVPPPPRIAREPVALKDAHVLIVEDNVPNFVTIARMLAHAGVSHAEWKTSGWQAIQSAETLPHIDLVLMDMRLPYEDGYQALEKIRKHDRLKDLLVVLCTAEASEDNMIKAANAGFDGFLGKPLDPDRFHDQIRRILANEPVWEL